MFHPRDRFASRFDTRDIIGCECDYPLVGFNFNVSASADSITGLATEVKAEADAVIGKASDEMVKAKGKVDQAIAYGEDISNAVNDFDAFAADVGDAIIDIASSPLVHATIGAVAVAAPPFSTIAAAVAEAALAYAVVIVELVEVIEDIWNDVIQWASCLFGCQTVEETRQMERIARAHIEGKLKPAAHAAKMKKAGEQLALLKEKARGGDKKALAAVLTLEEAMKKSVLIGAATGAVAANKWLDVLKRQGCSAELLANADPSKMVAKALCTANLKIVQALPQGTAESMRDTVLLNAFKSWDKVQELADAQLPKIVVKQETPKQKAIPMPSDGSKKGNLYEGIRYTLKNKKTKKGVFRYDADANFSDYSTFQAVILPTGRIVFGQFSLV